MTQRKSALTGIDLAGAAAALGFTALVYFVGIAPAQRAVDEAANERVALAEQEAAASRLENTLRTTRAKLDQLLAAQEEPGAGVGASANDRLGRISVLAQQGAVSITGLTPRPEVKGTRFNRVPISISGLGTPPGFLALLKRLHEEFPDMQVASLAITGNPAVRGAPAQLEAELVWYTVADAPGAAGAGGSGREAAVPAGRP